MSEVWLDPGSHGVRFYDGEVSAHDSIADFFTAGANPKDPLILVSRRATFEAVADLLASGRYGSPVTADRIHFFDAEAALTQIWNGHTLDRAQSEAFFAQLLVDIRRDHPDGTIRLFGEGGNLLCERGHFDAAVELEGIAGHLFTLEPRLSILCGYSLAHFRDGDRAIQFRAVCDQHTHAAPDDAAPNPPEASEQPQPVLQPGIVYVIDDDASIRRALGRLLSLTEWQVQTFDSAEAFLAALNDLSPGCLVVDIQLGGMSGLDLLDRIAAERPSWPTVAMSGSHNQNAETEALRLGARVFLHKPFDPQALLDAIAGAFA